MSDKKILLQIVLDNDENISVAFGDDSDISNINLIGILEQIKYDILRRTTVISQPNNKYDA